MMWLTNFIRENWVFFLLKLIRYYFPTEYQKESFPLKVFLKILHGFSNRKYTVYLVYLVYVIPNDTQILKIPL
ncbi:MAG: hypothetical protein FD188_3575 [Ignavibacteria bacterium]|nr:MAG: hypothetical protein FD188_3575 [Ignavibacteria bacterium]